MNDDVTSLRAEVRRLRAVSIGALAVALALPVLAFGPASSLLRADRVEAREIDLIDASGNAVVSLRADDGGSVTIVGADGEVAIQLGELAGENTVLRVRDRSSRGWGVIDGQSQPLDDVHASHETPPAPATAGDVRLRALEWASEADRRSAYEAARRGWAYVMPRPKSPSARWGYTHGSTTWFNGYWFNSSLERYSTAAPGPANDYQGDDARPDEWRRGGSPDAPSVVEWLCSEEGGIEPAKK
ncbi:MAG: hypothetical protein AAGH64_01020 [Planctomycetota bacterium]